MTYTDEGQEQQLALSRQAIASGLGEAADEGADTGDPDTDRLYARVNVALAEEPFVALVVEDARNKVSAGESRFLRSPSVMDRWNSALAALNRDLQSQFAERRAEAQTYRNRCMKAGPNAKQDWFDYQARYEHWRSRMTRLKGQIEQRLAESKSLLHQERANRRSRRRGEHPGKASGADSPQTAAVGEGEAGAEAAKATGTSSLPLLSDVADLLSKEGAVREPFAAQRDWLLRRITETFRLVRGHSVAEEAACASSSAGASTQPDSRQGQANEHNDARGGKDG